MLGSLCGQQVLAGEQCILNVLVLQRIGLRRPAPAAFRLGADLAGQAVLEQPLVLPPPVLPEQGFSHRLPRTASAHAAGPSARRAWRALLLRAWAAGGSLRPASDSGGCRNSPGLGLVISPGRTPRQHQGRRGPGA